LNPLSSLFAPRSIAIIGASRKEGSLGKMFLDAIVKMNYRGKTYPVNPKADLINNIPCYPDILSVPEIPDLAIILLPKEMVYEAVETVAKKEINNIVVISAGFKEVGEEGEIRENELLNLIRKNNIRMIGPNSMGLFNTQAHISLNATFSPTTPIPGHVGFVSQSGALGVAVLELSQKLGLGFSSFVSTGNKADVGDVECLRFLAEDENTKVIMLYQEGIDDPPAFRDICREIIADKPVLTVKAGRTKSGLKAASSHTGALASDDIITDAFLKQCGILRCQTIQEMMESALVLNSQPTPTGKKVGVITNAGGPGILVSDALEKYELDLADLSEKTRASLAKILPPEAGLNNPVDMIASATHETYYNVARILEKDSDVDSILVIIVKPPVNTTPKLILSEMKPLIQQSDKPFLFTVMADEDTDSGHALFREDNIPVFSYPETTARALGNLVRYADLRKSHIHSNYSRSDTFSMRNGNKKQAPINEILSLLENYQIRFCENSLVTTVDQAIEFYMKSGPVALKIANEEIIHKSDEGLVKLDLSSPDEVNIAFNDIETRAKMIIPKSADPLLLVQKMIPKGIEFILGAKQDPQFGLVIMFGIGGILVELYQDVVFRVAPLDEATIEEMIDELKGKKILSGFRNFPVINRQSLIQMIMNFSELVMNQENIIEFDLNPIIFSPEDHNLYVVDARCTIVE
jgi:acetyltransferase